jgi:3'-phosphoadenosine 5'-phosphosulfate sulfotransferase (PAPS reductase)/FAD synthetase
MREALDDRARRPPRRDAGIPISYGKRVGLVQDNPLKPEKLPPKHPGGFRTWREDEITAFEEHHPIGSVPRLAFALALYTGAAAVDLVKLGRPNLDEGRIRYRRQKTERRKGAEETPLVSIPVLPALAEVLALAPADTMTETVAGSPYLLPDGNVQIAFSGGRTSAYMLRQIIDANGGLPDRVMVCFQNTGREMPATLDFVQEVGERWNVPIVWLEYRPEAPRFEVVSYNSASRDGEPFEAMIRKRKGLPYKFARFCTAELKVHASSRYARSLGWDRWTSVIGIRADEGRRIPKNPPRERFTLWHPLFAAGVTKRDISDFWGRQPFDLRLPNVNGRTSLGNCDGCFLKSEAALAALARDYPERFAWWEKMEAMAKENGWAGKNPVFNPDRPYAALGSYIRRQGDWLLSEDGALCQANDGECFG